AATATLSFGGTAVKGIDYEVTTNGNFTTPSNVLTFAAGSTAAQSFTVRIFDDYDVEPAENIIIDFTVNNGGGDASKGSTTPTFTISLTDNDIAPNGTSSGTYAIGVAGSTVNSTPFDARVTSQRAQYLYKASELIDAGVVPGN